ncbi:hypothetical protein IMSHALPRED_010461 [Imshaugia aleurites]|uniref:Uncharacterized protein n=1 Tax=Imshaugia aleurites TaxID=172621 RepID=A0A8H3IZ95_9LECA|nr:hypothetical protein IMSHALPRED_010461 [Imshaugia aleurites]
MKLSILSPAAAILTTQCFALPAPLPSPTHLPVLQDPSPPRPFPAGRIVEMKDPSPPRPFPKYPLIAGNPLEERDPSALSRFPTDGQSEAQDPSPPRPFPAGHFVEVEHPPPALQERDPSAPHKVVGVHTAATDPSPPRPFPKYALNDGSALEERDPLSRFPTDGEKEAEDPSPPRPFPAGRVVDVENSVPSHKIEPRSPSPLPRTATGPEAEANQPSPPRPFPAGQPIDVEPRAEDVPSHSGHGGYFPPTNPPVPEPTAPTMEADLAKILHARQIDIYPYPPAANDHNHNLTPPSIPHHPASTSTSTPTPPPPPPPPTHTPQLPHLPLKPHHHLAQKSHTCTKTITSYHLHPFHPTGPSTVYNATVTVPHRIDCGGCALTVAHVGIGHGLPVLTAVATVTDPDSATTTEYVPWCSRSPRPSYVL